jgi:predicted dienelactone hydrolase
MRRHGVAGSVNLQSLLFYFSICIFQFLSLPLQAKAQEASYEKENIAGLSVAVWKPSTQRKAPLILFSHGFHGSNLQSKFLARHLASAGYFVFAPNHEDANGIAQGWQPVVPFKDVDHWSDATYRNRGEDFQKLLKALHEDKTLADKIDFSKIGLIGHSLGGYTVLGLSGAYPSWKLPGVKAVVALSPYCEPFVVHDQLKNIQIPVMYQGGTRDFGITPTVKRPGGAFDKTPGPAYLVVFDQVGHLGFTDLDKDSAHHELIDHYTLAFFNKYVRGENNGEIEKKLAGVSFFSIK